MIREAIGQVVVGHHLDEVTMTSVMREIMEGEATPAQIASFITALRMKGESLDEIVGAVRVMREKATPVDAGVNTAGEGVLVDTCGTGGDGSGTFNVSTISAFVVAGAGVPVAKHGNRAVSSRCGSADVLEALGVNLALSASQIGRCIRQTGIGFLFAPALHGAMKHAIGPRREIGIRTIFNILGPMTNPAGANVQVLGVFSRELTETLARVLLRLGSRRALVVWGEGGFDELTITGTSYIADASEDGLRSYTVTPEELGFTRATVEELRGGANAAESALQVRELLAGASGPKRDMVLLNSGAALMAAGWSADLIGGVELARRVLDSGAALARLDALVEFTRTIEAEA
ncbi:MAG: anthranilate phosphoribosyltransferase [Desulfobulbaceae bacterium A2]|nr:MAG: anthranilate phosphoribosyltransferase [Desulfobulbaceae bacterium A2]